MVNGKIGLTISIIVALQGQVSKTLLCPLARER